MEERLLRDWEEADRERQGAELRNAPLPLYVPTPREMQALADLLALFDPRRR